MPGARPAPRKRLRARSLKSAKHRLMEITKLSMDMENPLNEATYFVHALRLIGHGIEAQREESGEPIMAVAIAAQKRLEELKESWDLIFKAAKGD